MKILRSLTQKYFFQLTENRQIILKNSFWQYLEKFVRMLVGIFIFAWMARYLGKENFGRFSYALTLITMFEPVVSVGLPLILKKYLVLYPSRKYEYLGSSFCVYLLGAIFSIGVICVYLVFCHDSQESLLTKVMMIALLFRSFDVIEIYFDSQLKTKLIVLSRISSIILTTIARIIMIILNFDMVFFAWAYLIEFIFFAMFYLMAYFSQDEKIFYWKPNLKLMKRLIHESWPLAITGLTVFLYMRIDQVMLNYFIGPAEVGLYSAAIKLSEFWFFIPVAISTSVFPIILKAKHHDEKDYYNKLQKLFSFMTVISLIICFILFITADDLISILYKNAYNDSVGVLRIHCWCLIFVFWGISLSVWDTAEGMMKYSLVRTTVGAFVNIFFNFILIPKFLGRGAAFASVSSYFCSTFLINYFYPRARKIFFIQLNALRPKNVWTILRSGIKY